MVDVYDFGGPFDSLKQLNSNDNFENSNLKSSPLLGKIFNKNGQISNNLINDSPNPIGPTKSISLIEESLLDATIL